MYMGMSPQGVAVSVLISCHHQHLECCHGNQVGLLEVVELQLS